MADNYKRKCLKCGRSPAMDTEAKLYRFPKPGPTNAQRCEAWAKFCLPDRDWASIDFQRKLYAEHRMLCDKHFKKALFTDYSVKKLNRHAVPVDKFLFLRRRLDDPNVIKKHCDHTYSGDDGKDCPDKGDRIDDPNVIKKHCDHTYSGDDGKDCPDKGDRIDCEENEFTGVNIPEPKQRALSFDDNNVEDENIATDIHSDIDDQEIEESQFSWQKANQICIEDDDNWDNIVTTEIKDETVEKVDEDKPDENKHGEDYFCDNCRKSIVGFRYRCVQCENYDLCHSCESKMLHPHHYMLRIPKPRPFSEIKSILDAVRDKIKELTEELKENSFDFEEIKLEPEFDNDSAADPLSYTPRVQTPHIATLDITTSHKAPDTQPMHIATMGSLSKFEAPSHIAKTPLKTLVIATPQFKAPLIATSHIKQQPASATKKPQSSPVMIEPTVLLRKLNLIKDNVKDVKRTHEDNKENPHENDGNRKKLKLTTYIEEAFEEIPSDAEETWLEEDILDEEIAEEFDLDRDKSDSTHTTTYKHTRNKNLQHTEG